MKIKTLDCFLFCLCCLIFVSGIVTALLITEKYTPMLVDERIIPHWGIIFSTILYSNIIVGIILSVCGILTGGISTVAVLFWNGFLVGKLLNVPYFRLWEISSHFIFHGIFELTSFFLFGTIGFKGVIMICQYVKGKEVTKIDLLSMVRIFIIAVTILVIASTIETISIIYL